METINTLLDELTGMHAALFLDGGMFVEGKLMKTDATTVTIQLQINSERQAFSGGNDLRKITTIHATILKEKIFRVDRIATASPTP